MAETTAADATQRYAVIEQAYAKENWDRVVRDGEVLLQELRRSDNPQLMGLQMRLQLLLGHTQLYGYGDKAAAGRFYGAVAEKSGEAALTRIAEQGLKQCVIESHEAAEALPEPPSSTEQEATTPLSAAGAPASPSPDLATPAAPWLTAAAGAGAGAAATISSEGAASFLSPPGTGGEAEGLPLEAATAQATAAPNQAATPWSQPSLIPDVVEEPELIELHQADPALAEDVELTWKESNRGGTPAEQDDEELRSGLLLVKIR